MPIWSKTKAKIFSGAQRDVENQLNDFLGDQHARVIKDMRFSTSHIPSAPISYSVLVLYDEIDIDISSRKE